MFCQLNIKQNVTLYILINIFILNELNSVECFVIIVNWTKIYWHGILIDTHVYCNCEKKNAYHKPAVNVASHKTFILKHLRISMASVLKYFNPG